MTVPVPPSRFRLRFAALPVSLTLEAVPDRLARRLARRWLAELGPAADETPSYTLRFRTDAMIPRPRRRTRIPAARHRCVAGRDVLSVPGGRLAISPGSRVATLRLHPDALALEAVTATLVEAALGHALALQGGCLVHAAALELERRDLLVLGPTGAGKSTLAAAALACGGRVISDDSLLLGRSRSGRPALSALRRDVWLRRDSLRVLPVEARERCERFDAPLGERWRLRRDELPGRFIDGLTPSALILLRRDLRLARFRTRPVDQAQALASLLEATSALYLTDPRYARERGALLPLLAALAEELPAAEVGVGRALVEDPCRTLSSILERLRPA